MKASLDTNVIIHFYRAGLQSILFDVFDEGTFIYEQIRNIELENHGKDVLDAVDADIAIGKIVLYTDQKLKEQAVYKVFENNVCENRNLYRINNDSQLNWTFRSQVRKFIMRFLKEPYREEERQWIQALAGKYGISIKTKLGVLNKLL